MRSRLPAKRRKWLSRGSTLPGASEENSKYRNTLISDQHSCFRQLGSLLRQGVNSGALPLACGSKLGLLLCKIAKTQPGTSFLAGSRLNVAGRGVSHDMHPNCCRLSATKGVRVARRIASQEFLGGNTPVQGSRVPTGAATSADEVSQPVRRSPEFFRYSGARQTSNRR